MLSLAELKAGNFVRLFRDLKVHKDELHISSYGVKNTTLEEIFMKVISERLDSESDICPTESNEHIESNENVVIPNSTEGQQKSAECIQMGTVSKASLSKETLANGSLPSDKDSLQLGATASTPIEVGDGDCAPSEDELQPEEGQEFLREENLNEKIDDPRLTPKFPVWQQFCAIIQKRYLCTKRNLEGLISQILLPSFFVSVAMSVALTAPDITDLPELILSPTQFYAMSKPDENVMGLANNKLDLFEDRLSDDAVSSDIAATFSLPSGPGATCVLKSPYILSKFVEDHYTPGLLKEEFFDSMCGDFFQNGIPFSTGEFSKSTKPVLPEELKKLQISKERNYPICYCGEEKTTFICPSYGYSEPVSYETVTGDLIYDISGQNESQYYLYTTDKFRYQQYSLPIH